ncbi:MAG: sialidase family protein [Gaiellaceae bacterium]
MKRYFGVFGVLIAVLLAVAGGSSASSADKTYDINTLAGKVASLNGTAPLQIRFSAFIEEEAEEAGAIPGVTAPITPVNILMSPLDGTSVTGPAVTVNQDTAGAPQNETSIAVDPNNPNRVVGSANDYVARTWSCSISGTPCSALGDGYSGTYYSNNAGATWCCSSSDPAHLGTLIPGVTHLTGGPYDAGGDPSVAFDSQGNVYYAGLGFNRTSAPNTVAVNKGTFSAGGSLSWSAPTFINATSSPSTLNDKEWIAVDANASSPFRDRVYVTWTRFVFSAGTGSYVQSPIMFASSSNGGQTFTDPKLISGNVLYGQGSHPVVGPDGTLYVFWDASTRHQALDSTWMVKSTDGGATWSKPAAVSTVADILPLAKTAFRVNSFPAAAAAPNGDLYVTWTGEVPNDGSTYAGTAGCAYWLSGTGPVQANCHSAAVYSKSTDGGTTWSAPVAVFTQGSQSAAGYPVTQPDGSTFNAPATAGKIEDVFPAASASANGKVYLGTYRATTVSPWQTCAAGPAPPPGRITCDTLGPYIHNARLDYVVRDVTTNVTNTVSTHLINTRNGFGGTFFGDYTDLTAASNGTFHALWTDSNNQQSVEWFYGFQFVPSALINQEDVVTASGNY